MELGAVKIRVTLDESEAKRQLEELKRQRERATAPVERARSKLDPYDAAGRYGIPQLSEEQLESLHSIGRPLPEHIRFRLRKRSAIRYEYGLARQNQERPGFIEATKDALAPAAKLAAATAATYGIVRAATTATYLTMEGLKAALPDALRDNPLWTALQEQIENVSKAMDNFESRIMSAFKAVSTTKEVAFAAARLTGRMPELGAYWDRAQQMAVQERDLALAFDRFKNKDIASGVGAKVRELTAESMNNLFSQSMAK